MRLWLFIAGFTLIARVVPAQTLSERVIESNHPVVVAIPLVGFPLSMAMAAQVPFGFEGTANSQSSSPTSQARKLDVNGMTVKEALDLLVAQDARYQWSEENGVIHVWPREPFADPDHALDHALTTFVESVSLHDVTLASALTASYKLIQAARRKEPSARLVDRSIPTSSSAQAVRRFNVKVNTGTIRDVLDAIVRAHGAASWFVTYVDRDPSSRLDGPRLGFMTFDGSGMSEQGL